MGGYAALMFGMLLNADRIVAFGSLSHLDPAEAIRYGDLRFLRVMEALAADPPRSGYFDLARLGADLDYRGQLHLIFGTHPGGDDEELGNLDAIHAIRLSRSKDVTLHPYPESDHPVVKWLIDHHQIDDLLTGLLADDRGGGDASFRRPSEGAA